MQKKSVIRIPKLEVGQYLFIFNISYYLKISLIYSKILTYKRKELCSDKKTKKKKDAKSLKIK